MKAIERIIELMEQKNIKQKNLAEMLSVNKSLVANWKMRNCDPPIEYLPQICNILDTSYEYIITGEENNNYLTVEEKELISTYRSSNEKGKQLIIESSKAMQIMHHI